MSMHAGWGMMRSLTRDSSVAQSLAKTLADVVRRRAGLTGLQFVMQVDYYEAPAYGNVDFGVAYTLKNPGARKADVGVDVDLANAVLDGFLDFLDRNAVGFLHVAAVLADDGQHFLRHRRHSRGQRRHARCWVQ